MGPDAFEVLGHDGLAFAWNGRSAGENDTERIARFKVGVEGNEPS